MKTDTTYRTKYIRLSIPAGTLVIKSNTYDYGLASYDTEHTGYKHYSVKIINKLDSNWPDTITICESHLEEVNENMLPIEPTLEEPKPELINGKKVIEYVALYNNLFIGQSALVLLNGIDVNRTTNVVAINGSDFETENTYYRLKEESNE